MAGSLQRGAAGRRRRTWLPEDDASSAFAARAAGRILADLEVGHGRRARYERGAVGPEATACTVLFAEACAQWPAVIFRAGGMPGTGPRVRDCSARGLVGIGTRVPGRSVTASSTRSQNSQIVS